MLSSRRPKIKVHIRSRSNVYNNAATQKDGFETPPENTKINFYKDRKYNVEFPSCSPSPSL